MVRVATLKAATWDFASNTRSNPSHLKKPG